MGHLSPDETTADREQHIVFQNSLVIIPTYNEVQNVTALIEEIRAHWPGVHLLFIDDNSPDGTGKLLEDLKQRFANIEVLHRTSKSGLGSAYRLGISHALKQGYWAVFQMDADLSHAPSDLPRLADTLIDASVAVGSRYIPNGRTVGWTKRRKLLSRLGSLMAHLISEAEISDMTSGFVGYRADALRNIDIHSITANGFAYQIEIKTRLQRTGCLTTEIPITFRERAQGTSKMNLGIITEGLRTLATIRKL
jgi:dolichol-phosphate mannosyltransferase